LYKQCFFYQWTALLLIPFGFVAFLYWCYNVQCNYAIMQCQTFIYGRYYKSKIWIMVNFKYCIWVENDIYWQLTISKNFTANNKTTWQLHMDSYVWKVKKNVVNCFIINRTIVLILSFESGLPTLLEFCVLLMWQNSHQLCARQNFTQACVNFTGFV
jgi:hypothetical protein